MCCHGAVVAAVRPASPADAPLLADVHLRTALAAYAHIFPPEAPAPTPEEVLAQWDDWLRAGSHRGFVATAGDEVLGAVLAGPDPAEEAAGHLSRLYVDPDHWGAGVGTLLYRSAVAHLRAARFDQATLWVLERNERARGWYERLGWRATGERKAVYEPAGIDDLRYRLTLR